MSAITPAASTPGPEAASPATASQDANASASSIDRQILEYLRARGHKAAEQALLESLEQGGTPDENKAGPSSTISTDDLVKKLAIITQKSTKPGDSSLKDASTVLSEMVAIGNSVNIQNLVSSIGNVGAEDILSLDPGDKQEGYRELEAWVEGSLDMYRPEFRPILFPIFVHFYLDLIQHGFKDAALKFFADYSASLAPAHSATLHHLSTLHLPTHVQNDELAQRFRNEKYTIRMSRSGFSLLIGWLNEGIGGESLGSGVGFAGEKGKRGRGAIMRVVNNHLKFDVTSAPGTSVSAESWEESSGLLSSLIPQTAGSTTYDPMAFNAAKGQLKLGPAPVPEDLQHETERVVREQSMVDRDPGAQTVDVKREVEKIRDARKRIRLDPSALSTANLSAAHGAAARSRAIPSICAYTLHDVGEGAPCVTFSQDTSLMAAGFSESYVRLWSLKGEKLKGLRSDFQTSSITGAKSLRKIREKGGSTTRKLIGHSGPVYSVAFDPVGGSAVPPKYLLSCSADATTRLWSLDTMTNVAVYRGHQNPVWDVQWSPMGVYFATASRDRTARLWSTDRASALRIYAGHLSDVDCVRFHPNSLYLATGSSDWTARLWDVQRGSCVRVFIGHQNIVSTMAFSPDGKYLATAGEDLAINIWDIGSGRRVKKMTGHTASIYSLAWSAESSVLVSGGADWTVRCWDAKSSGGPASKSNQNGMIVNGYGGEENGITKEHDELPSIETSDLLATFPTKRTPIVNVQFTPRNLCLVAGPYLSPEQR
ncbi:unnamed protein product [Somion occarium]|uniref:TFIID subunit TAF5 NTD2 domain-containing protein n=1 Tax=Somion occarium TaxID=3059160 RepID=A0ABP1CIW1_9APHY